MAKIHFIDKNIKVEVRDGTDLLELYQRNPAVPFAFGCCKGICGKCAINVSEGKENLTKISPQETMTLQEKGYEMDHRLACQCALNGDITISNTKKLEKTGNITENDLSTHS